MLNAIDIILEWLGRLYARLRGRRYGGRGWTSLGGSYYPLDMRPGDVFVEDVARGLATEARYAGQGRHYYSVAEHSVLVSIHAAALAQERGLSARDVLAAAVYGMGHDAGEAYVGDVVRPLKYGRAMRGYRRAEKRAQRACELALIPRGVPDHVRALVHKIDNHILTDEINVLFPFPSARTRALARYGPGVGAEVLCLGPREAESLFLKRWAVLTENQTAAAA